jgi:hypothetical protein
MALRTKTVEYVFPLATASVASATARDLTTFTLNIPETASRTFRSVHMEASFEDNVTTASTITAVLLGIQIDAVARSDATVTQSLTNSGENQSYTITREITSYFQTNFTAASHTMGARITVTGASSVNVSIKLVITYQYEDSSATTRIKTVKIPIDGNNGNLTGTLANVAGLAGQIPALNTFLPEASKVYRDIFFEIYVHSGMTNALTGTYSLNMRYDGATTISTAHRGDLNSDCTIVRRDKLISGGTPSITTSTTNNVQASTSAGTPADCPFPCLGGVLVVTYEYNHSTSTTILNSIELPAVDEAGWVGGTTLGDASEFRRTFFIQEPGTISLVQSGVLMSCIDAGTITMDIRVGAQTSRVYTHASTQRCGCVFFMRRFDSGATGSSAGYTYDRGLNTFEITFFTSSTTAGNIGSNVSGIIYLNYTSGKATDGDGAHSHTTKWINRPYSASSFTQKLAYTATITPVLPETSYYTVAVGFNILLYCLSVTNAGFCFQGEVNAGEGSGAGWYDFYSTFLSTDAENGQSWIWARARDEFKRHPLDVESDRLDLEASRSYRFDAPATFITHQATQFITYHSITYPITVTIQNSSGGTITVNLHRFDNGEMVLTTSRTGDGDVTFNWYDDTIEVYAVAIDGTGGEAVSDVAGNATTYPSRLLDFAGGGGGPTYYAYSG